MQQSNESASNIVCTVQPINFIFLVESFPLTREETIQFGRKAPRIIKEDKTMKELALRDSNSALCRYVV